MLFRVIVAETNCVKVSCDHVLLGCECIFNEFRNDAEIDLKQRCECTDVCDVLHQDPRTDAVKVLVAHLRQRNPNNGNVFSVEQATTWPRRVIDQPASRSDLIHVLRVSLHVHRNHDVDAIGPRLKTVFGHANLKPGWQALDIRWEEVLADDRHAHPEDGLHQQTIGAG